GLVPSIRPQPEAPSRTSCHRLKYASRMRGKNQRFPAPWHSTPDTRAPPVGRAVEGRELDRECAAIPRRPGEARPSRGPAADCSMGRQWDREVRGVIRHEKDRAGEGQEWAEDW